MGKRLPTGHRWLRRSLVAATALGLLGAGAVGSCVVWTRVSSAQHIRSAETVMSAPVTLVMGTLVRRDGTPTRSLRSRLQVARDLYVSGKAQVIMVSGDRHGNSGDEIAAMTRWLVTHSVPARKVVTDPYGLDTYDSCLRARQIFGARHAIVVTQTYHLARAVTLCRHAGIDASGVGSLSSVAWEERTVREYLACVKAVYRVVVHATPQVSGPPDPGLEQALSSR